MRLFLFAAFIFIIFASPVWAEEEQCTLKNTQFCGVWEGKSHGGGGLTVLGHKMFYEKDTSYYTCDIVDEETTGPHLYTILKCQAYFRGREDKPEPWLFRLSYGKKHFHYSKSSFESLYVYSADHLPCLFTKWEHKKIQDAYDFYQCGPSSYIPYSREIPYEGKPDAAE